MQGEPTRKRKERADRLVVEKGLAENRQKAQALILAGSVYAGGERVAKPGLMLDTEMGLELKGSLRYVSRGGLKLEEALDAFQIPVEGKIAADLGASTGGFTDCLLKRGAKKVYAVDVDTRQIDWHLRNDSRVSLLEKNARYLEKGDLPESLDIVTLDVSFISVLKILAALKEILGEGKLLVLVKPQFEADRGQVGRKGVVRDPALHQEVLTRVVEAAAGMGFCLEGLMRLSVLGQKGNQEFFLYLTLRKASRGRLQTLKLIKEAVSNERD